MPKKQKGPVPATKAVGPVEMASAHSVSHALEAEDQDSVDFDKERQQTHFGFARYFGAICFATIWSVILVLGLRANRFVELEQRPPDDSRPVAAEVANLSKQVNELQALLSTWTKENRELEVKLSESIKKQEALAAALKAAVETVNAKLKDVAQSKSSIDKK